MNARLANDIRLIGPAWLGGMTLIIASAFLPHTGKAWVGTITVVGCLIIAGSVFGAEFGHGTLPQLLAQPIERRRIWWAKMLVLALGLSSLILILLTIEHATWPVAIVAAAAFCTVPFFTLVGRSTISGIILSIPIPGLIFIIGALLGLWLLRPSGETVNEERLHFWMRAYFYVVLPGYCAVVFYLGYRRFVNFEVAGREPPQVRLPASVQGGLERIVSNLIPSEYRYVRALVAKELHLQHNATVLLLIFATLQLLAILYAKIAQVQDAEPFFTVPLFIYLGTMPCIIGSSAVAEENNLGTRSWHLTLPCSIRLQWFVKLSVVALLATVFVVAVPAFWLILGCSIGMGLESISIGVALLFCSPTLVVTLIAFYASSFSRDTLRALLAAFGICASIVTILALGGSMIESSTVARRQPQHASTIGLLATGWILFGLPLSCLLVLALRSSFKHFAALGRGRIWRNVLTVVLCPIVLFFLLLILVFSVR